MPRQMPTTGRSRVNAASSSAKSTASRASFSSSPALGSGGSPYRLGWTSAPPVSSSPSMRASASPMPTPGVTTSSSASNGASASTYRRASRCDDAATTMTGL